MEMSTKQKFKVGDRVRVLRVSGPPPKVSGVPYDSEIVRLDKSLDGTCLIVVKTKSGDDCYLCTADELQYISDCKPTRAWALKDKRGRMRFIYTTRTKARSMNYGKEHAIVRGVFVEDEK
jgi:hypothetical protein